MDKIEIEGKAFGLGGRWKKVRDDIPIVLETNQTVIIEKKCKKEKTIKVYAIFLNEDGRPQMERLQTIPND